jgi:DNA-binding transcriptional regulator GbsR (MarR family)
MSVSDVPSSKGADAMSDAARRRAVVDRFVEFWGEMASSWGINRTMARVHALLYCVEQPLNTDQIMERLQISRGSANMNLRALVDWRLAEKTDVADSRKDHYTAETDVWHIMARIVEERERRELRPVRQHLRDCVDALPTDPDADAEADRALHERLQNLMEVMEVVEEVSEALLPLIKNREADLIKRLVGFVQALDASPSEERPTEPSSS